MSVIFRKQLYENCRLTKGTIQKNKLLRLKNKQTNKKDDITARLMSGVQT